MKRSERKERKIMEGIRIEKSKIIAVEGDDEVYFIDAMMNHLRISDVQPLSYGGKDNLRPYLVALTKVRDFNQVTSLGVVRDAHSDAEATFMSITGALANANLPVPEKHLETIGTKPKVTVFINPNGKDIGSLEDLLLEAVTSSPEMPCVEKFFECVKESVGSLPGNISKAKVAAYLAAKPIPGLPLGTAAHKSYWPLDSNSFANVRNFLLSM